MASKKDRKSKKRKWAASQSADFTDLPAPNDHPEEITDNTPAPTASSKPKKTKTKGEDQIPNEDSAAKKRKVKAVIDSPDVKKSATKPSLPETNGGPKKSTNVLRAVGKAAAGGEEGEEATAIRERALAKRKEKREKMKIKEKAKKKLSREQNLKDADEDPTDPSNPTPNRKSLTSRTGPAKARFILFIGNLPYTATTAQIRSHFSKLAPFTVRHSTKKDTGHSRGFAFLEFDSFDRMQTCLKLYHHSLFEGEGDVGEGDGGDRAADEKGKGGAEKEGEGTKEAGKYTGTERKARPRRINVELTAGGGGGKSQARKEKIKGKNAKLAEERARIHGERKDAFDGEGGGAGAGAGAGGHDGKGKSGGGERGGLEKGATKGAEVEGGNVHPSRQKRFMGQ